MTQAQRIKSLEALNAEMLLALKAVALRGVKLSGFSAQYDPWVGELVLVRETISKAESN